MRFLQRLPFVYQACLLKLVCICGQTEQAQQRESRPQACSGSSHVHGQVNAIEHCGTWPSAPVRPLLILVCLSIAHFPAHSHSKPPQTVRGLSGRFPSSASSRSVKDEQLECSAGSNGWKVSKTENAWWVPLRCVCLFVCLCPRNSSRSLS